MGLYALCLAGGGFVLIGAWEALISSYAHLDTSFSPLSTTNHTTTATTTATTMTTAKTRRTAKPFSSSVSFIAIALLSFFFILNSLLSLMDALNANDRIGLVLQLEVLPIASLFLLYSVVGVLIDFTDSIPVPSSILSLIAFFAFGLEFLLFYLQKKDPSGIENRYFDLILVPITVCVFSTILELTRPKSNFPSLVRGVGLILQGTWFVQMGFSFCTSLMAHGCALHEKSRGNYTVRCRGHPEYHRSRALATLEFNCHLAFLVVLIVGVYSFIGRKYGAHGDYMLYKLLSEELQLQQFDSQTQFRLDSDDHNDEIKEEDNVVKQKAVGVNGFGSH